jgi:DNA repair protein RadD
MIQPRWYQEEAINAIYHYFTKNSGNPVIGLPTGSGKTLIPAIFIQRVLRHWPTQRFLMLTHVKELIEQAANVMNLVWPEAPLGIYSAGLKSKQLANSIIFAGIQSAIKNPMAFGTRNIIFVDEVHMVNQDETSMYRTFLAAMKLINPDVKLVGLSATLYRMGQGYITDGGLFTDIIYDMTGLNGFNRLIAEGHLCTLVPRRTTQELDVSNVGISKGDYIGSQLQHAVDKNDITYKALRESIEFGHDRKSWLIFSSGISHANHIAEMLNAFGIECASVHSKQTPEYNDTAIKAFKNGQLRAIANYGKLTTGFDYAGIDLIIMLRPTLSIPLWVQMLGRGTRPCAATNKQNCMVLDFARNTPRLGCVNDPIIPRKKNSAPGDVPVKLCPECGTYNHTRVQFCTSCGHEFQFQNKLVAKSGLHEIIKTDISTIPIYETFDVAHVTYSKRQKVDYMANGERNIRPAYIRATYVCGMQAFSENVFPEGKPYAKMLFHKWWMQRANGNAPATADEVLPHINKLRHPKRIKVWVNRKWPEIVSAEY